MFIQNSELSIIPVCITKIKYVQLLKNLKVFNFVRLSGYWSYYQIGDNANYVILATELLVAVPGVDIPLVMPQWNLDLHKILV